MLDKKNQSALIGLLLLVILLVGGDPASAEIYFKRGSPHLKLANNALLSGGVEYSREGRPFNSFEGIPYGTILERFGEPKPSSAWEGVHNAVKPGNICVQPFMNPETGKLAKAGDEECLNLNVYVPMTNGQREGDMNVMVWIHGGGYISGSGGGYGPKYFMDEDIILVTINYRLGAFGFLSTGDDVLSGNYGLKDAVLALKWVQENIQNFGGNPEKVTIFGESAGAGAVHHLVLSPTTKGLFHNAISQSGSALCPWAYHPNPKVNAALIATHLGCPTSSSDPSDISSEEIADCLRKVDAEKLIVAQATFAPSWPAKSFPMPFGPVKEPKASASPFQTESPWTLILEDSVPHKQIPWMVGITKDEGVVMYANQIVHDHVLTNELDSNFPNCILKTTGLDKFAPSVEEEIVGKKIRKFYFGDKPISPEIKEDLINIYSDAPFLYGVRKSALKTAVKGKKNPVYLYEYAHEGPVSLLSLAGFPEVPEEDKNKVGHGDELPHQFNMEKLMPGSRNVIKPGSHHEDFSKHFVKLWVSFAINGKPNHTWGTSKEEWKPISKDELEGKSPLRWYKITSDPGYIVEDKVKERAQFWDEIHMDHFLQSLVSKPEGKTEL